MMSFMLKTFIFENETTYKSSVLQFPIYMNCQVIDIQQILDIYCSMNSIPQPLKIKVYDPLRNTYVPIDPNYGLDQSFLYPPMVMIKYKVDILHDSPELYQEGSDSQQADRKQRNKERTIREVIQCVKKWRQTHNTSDKSNNKVNLQEAAKIVGIAKKSLDDYYSQLRLAEKYGFDFYRNFDKKIGVLRLFVKGFRQKDKGSLKYDKLPKKLKIIDQYRDQESFRKISQTKKQAVKVQHNQQPQESVMESLTRNPQAIVPTNQYQKCFYRSFNFMLDDPQIPFMSGSRKNIKLSAQQQQQFILF